jgi:hypothetical protein
MQNCHSQATVANSSTAMQRQFEHDKGETQPRDS